jgi:hypothetical protein
MMKLRWSTALKLCLLCLGEAVTVLHVQGNAKLKNKSTKSEWGKIRATVERDQYRIHTGKHKNTYQTLNHVQGLRFAFTPEGLTVRIQKQKDALTWGLRLKSYGYGANLQNASAVDKFLVEDNRIEYHRRELVEWYINDPRGLEQGFTLQQKPAGSMDAAP